MRSHFSSGEISSVTSRVCISKGPERFERNFSSVSPPASGIWSPAWEKIVSSLRRQSYTLSSSGISMRNMKFAQNGIDRAMLTYLKTSALPTPGQTTWTAAPRICWISLKIMTTWFTQILDAWKDKVHYVFIFPIEKSCLRWSRHVLAWLSP